jgi:predicted nucleotidyltransferase
VGYLRGLVNRAAAGSFVAEHASRIASERRQRQKADDERREREAEERRLEAERATPEYQARIRAQREKLSRLRDDLKRRLGQGPPR